MDIMKKRNWLENLPITILSLYFAGAAIIPINSTLNCKGITLVMIFVLFTGISWIILRKLFPKLTSFHLNSKPSAIKKSEFIIYFGIILLFMLFAWGAMSPANASADITTQMEMANSGQYSNWHPVAYVFMFYTIPLKIHNSLEMVTLWQCGFVTMVLIYFCYFLRKYYFEKKGTILTLLLIVLNPAFMKMIMTPWKDIPFSWCVFLGTLLCIEIVKTRGNYIKNNWHKLLFIIVMAGVLLFRHNGVVSVFLVILALIFLFKKYRKFYIIAGIALIGGRFLLYGPVYNALNVEPDGGKVEMIGVPMNQIAYTYHHDMVDEDKFELLDQFATKEAWEKYYSPINFNDIKWFAGESKNTNFGNWASENFIGILKLWLDTGLKHPFAYIDSYTYVTSPIWGFYEEPFEEMFPPEGERTEMQNTLFEAFNNYDTFVTESVFSFILIRTVGVGFAIILVALGITVKKSGKHFERYIPFILVISNTLIIALMITGKETRFVYSQIICAVPLMIYALGEKVLNDN